MDQALESVMTADSSWILFLSSIGQDLYFFEESDRRSCGSSYKRRGSAPSSLPPSLCNLSSLSSKVAKHLHIHTLAIMAGSGSGSGGSSSPPCASCKLLRRRCTPECIFAPYFPPEDPHKFTIVHKVFGASNVSKMLQELPAQQRADAVSSLVYEANARLRDPVYGCVGAISYLQQQVSQLQVQLALAKAEILCVQMQQNDGQHAHSTAAPSSTKQQQQLQHQHMDVQDYHALTMQNGLMNTLNSTPAGHHQQVLSNLASGGIIMHDACLKKESLWA